MQIGVTLNHTVAGQLTERTNHNEDHKKETLPFLKLSNQKATHFKIKSKSEYIVYVIQVTTHCVNV